MSSELTPFLQRYLAGDVPLSAIDDAVQAWHEGGDARELPAYLGLTDDEYWRWVRNPQDLPAIVAEHRRSAKAGVAAE